MFLAWSGARVVGFSATRVFGPGAIQLAGLVVLQEFAGRGVGSRLLDAAAQDAIDGEMEMMVVRTELSNRRAQFYMRHGFELGTSVQEVVDGQPLDLIELMLDLRSAR